MYVDLVAVEHEPAGIIYLFQAPAWSRLKHDDKVVVRTKYGITEGTVVSSITIDPTSEAFDMYVKVARAELPLAKVLGKLEYREFVYEEEEDGTDKG